VNVVDSSGWLEYFADGPNADTFAPVIDDEQSLVVPASSVYEVFKRVYQQRGEGDALRAVALMLRGRSVPLDNALALAAARLSADLRLPMADAIMLATARAHAATLWTQDVDFADVPDVRYVPRR
jgi:predicted nucleic acid-binding protein